MHESVNLNAKQWVPNGQDAVLIESVDLIELNAKFKMLQQAMARPAAGETPSATASLRPETRPQPATIRLAQAPYQPHGVVLDYQILAGSTSSFTFTNATPNRHLYEDAVLAFDRSGGSHDGRLYLVYTDYPSGGGSSNTDVFLTYSDSLGSNWLSNPIRVNNDSTTLSQFWPAVAVNQTSGNLATAWYDCRNDAGDTNTACFAAVSRNGGVSLESNFQLCPGPSDATLLAAPASFDYGDFTGLAYQSGVMRFAWADNSNNGDPNHSNPDGTGAMDIYTCVLRY